MPLGAKGFCGQDVYKRQLLNKRQMSSWLLSLAMAVFAALWILPIVAGALTSFKSNLEVKMFAKDLNLIPHDWTLENYTYVLNYPAVPLFKAMGNTAVVCVASILLTLVLCTMSAYGFERFEFKGKETLFWGLFALSTIPVSYTHLDVYKRQTLSMTEALEKMQCRRLRMLRRLSGR